jgi:hypothetical protein
MPHSKAPSGGRPDGAAVAIGKISTASHSPPLCRAQLLDDLGHRLPPAATRSPIIGQSRLARSSLWRWAVSRWLDEVAP